MFQTKDIFHLPVCGFEHFFGQDIIYASLSSLATLSFTIYTSNGNLKWQIVWNVQIFCSYSSWKVVLPCCLKNSASLIVTGCISSPTGAFTVTLNWRKIVLRGKDRRRYENKLGNVLEIMTNISIKYWCPHLSMFNGGNLDTSWTSNWEDMVSKYAYYVKW